MSLTGVLLDENRILWIRYEQPLQPRDDVLETYRLIGEHIPHDGSTLWMISDARAIGLNPAQLIEVLSTAIKPGEGSVTIFHKQLKVAIVTSGNPIIKMGVNAMRRPPFGNLNLPLFEDFDAALTFVKARLSASD